MILMMTRIPKSQKFLEIRLLYFLFTIPHKIVFKDFVYFVGTDNLINKFLLVRIISIAYTIPNSITHPLSSADISIFLPEISRFCCVKKYRYRLAFDAWFLILLTFLGSLIIFLINVVTTLNKGFLKQSYDFIISGYDVINKFLSYDSNYVIDVAMWPKFGNCIFSMRKVIITSIL